MYNSYVTQRDCKCTHLWGCHEVHLKQTGLERSLSWTIVLEGIQQERGALLDHVHLHEHIDNLREKIRALKYSTQTNDIV